MKRWRHNMNDTPPDTIPENWIKSDVGTAYHVLGGGTPSTSVEEYWGGNIPWITSADIGGVREINVTRYVTQKGVQESATNKVPNKSLLVATRVGLGKITIADEPICFSQDLQGLVQNPDLVLPEFGLFYLSFQLQRLKFEGRGTTISGITKKQLKDTEFLLPPYQEQRRIVSKIEKLFSELDKGIESLKSARAKLNVYRQAVLKNAFEGKLTAQWREENKDKLETPERLLARIKQERESRYDQQLQEWKTAVKNWEEGGKTAKKPAKPKAPKTPKTPTLHIAEELATLPELPEGWSWTRFGLLDIELKRGPFGSSITKSIFVQSGFKVYEQGNAIYRDVSRGSYFINDEKYKELSGFIVLPGDFIVSCAGTVGRIFELPENAMAGIINQALMRVRINDKVLSKRFFEKLFESAFFQRKVLSDAKGTAMVNLAGIKELNLVPVAICNMSEQKIIDELLDSRLSEIDQCERSITTALQQTDALRQSILKHAFSGQLIPQDPHDEPASILLERIKAEKAARSLNNTRAKRRRTKATA